MWAHYGAKHYGVCLGFDVPDGLVECVSYQPKRLKFDIDLEAPNAGLNPKTVKAMLLTKFEAWRYEKEHRVLAELKDRDEKDGFYYVEFGQQMTLREMVIGVRCEVSQREVATCVGDLDSRVEIRKARLAFNDYRLVEQRNLPVLIAGNGQASE
ncbi:DUF2971 domain-containing protein [Paraburkholderia sp. SIMBA_049]